ncbi:MAG: DUF3365 domain-containing protein, partial [Desulfobulbaceae bacterium]|nr:DUF3365 domain-containing protein [Desulfobulbaceae bacterium]
MNQRNKMPFAAKGKKISRFMLYTGLPGLFWTVVICVLLVSTFHQPNINMEEVAKSEARAALYRDLIYRRWNTMHGGVYAPINDRTPPNPFLEVAERDIQTPLGRRLTLINPAYMTRQVHEIEAKETGIQGHITSLSPINPQNASDPWETQALRAFEKGEAEVSALTQMNGASYIRLMRPFLTERGCLQCHAKQGYREGDIRGGISVSVPMELLYAQVWRNKAVQGIEYGIIWLLGLIGITLGSWRIKIEIDERTIKEGVIRESEQRLTQIFNFLPDATFVIDKEGKVQAWNHAVEEITGIKSEAML